MTSKSRWWLETVPSRMSSGSVVCGSRAVSEPALRSAFALLSTTFSIADERAGTPRAQGPHTRGAVCLCPLLGCKLFEDRGWNLCVSWGPWHSLRPGGAFAPPGHPVVQGRWHLGCVLDPPLSSSFSGELVGLGAGHQGTTLLGSQGPFSLASGGGLRGWLDSPGAHGKHLSRELKLENFRLCDFRRVVLAAGGEAPAEPQARGTDAGCWQRARHQALTAWLTLQRP